MRFTPIKDVLVIITALPTHHQEPHLAQRIGNFPGLPRILYRRQMIEQHRQLGLADQVSIESSESEARENSAPEGPRKSPPYLVKLETPPTSTVT